MKYLSMNDFERLSSELRASTNSSEEWAEGVGLDCELLNEIGNVMTNMAHRRTMDAARAAFEESGFDCEDPPEDADGIALKMNVGEIIKEACISAFALGFETHKQFGGTDAEK